MFSRPPDEFDYAATRRCRHCQLAFAGRYCSRCGEKVIEPEDRTLRAFAASALNAYTFIEGRFWRSLRTLCMRPGAMSLDIARGVRRPYMAPVALFFVANFLYFLLPGFETFNSTLDSQLHWQPYSPWAQAELARRLDAAGMDRTAFVALYDAASQNWSKLLLVLLVLALFPWMALINHRRDRLLADHLLYSFEFGSFVLFVPTIMVGLLVWLLGLAGAGAGLRIDLLFQHRVLDVVLVATLVYALSRGLRSFYGHGVWRTVLSTILVLVALQGVLTLYRLLLFVVVLDDLLPD